MRDKNFIHEIERTFQSYFEKTITDLKSNHPQFADLTNTAIINMQDDYLTAEIKRRNPYINLTTLSEFRRSEYNKALIQQLFYVLTEGDFRQMSGYDILNNTFVPKGELAKRYLAQSAKDTLTNAGFFYPAAKGGSSYRRGY